jgi:hypothetical protein
MSNTVPFAATTDPAQLGRAACRAWRIALVAYLVPVTIATHWPRLGFGSGGPIDKFVHFLAFGVLAWLWMHAKPFGRASAGWGLAAAWVFVDERTQALEILGRTFSGYDMIAGWLGVAMAGALYALMRAGTPAGTAARADAELARDVGSASRGAWMSAAFVTSVVIVVLGGLFVFKGWWADGTVNLGSVIYAIGYSGFVGVAIAAYGVGLFGEAYAARQLGRPLVRVPREAMPFWRIGFMVAAAFLLSALYELLVRALFGVEPADEVKVDHGGFLVLRQGFLLAAALVSIALGNTIGARAAFRANPALAEAALARAIERPANPSAKRAR